MNFFQLYTSLLEHTRHQKALCLHLSDCRGEARQPQECRHADKRHHHHPWRNSSRLRTSVSDKHSRNQSLPGQPATDSESRTEWTQRGVRILQEFWYIRWLRDTQQYSQLQSEFQCFGCGQWFSEFLLASSQEEEDQWPSCQSGSALTKYS